MTAVVLYGRAHLDHTPPPQLVVSVQIVVTGACSRRGGDGEQKLGKAFGVMLRIKRVMSVRLHVDDTQWNDRTVTFDNSYSCVSCYSVVISRCQRTEHTSNVIQASCWIHYTNADVCLHVNRCSFNDAFRSSFCILLCCVCKKLLWSVRFSVHT